MMGKFVRVLGVGLTGFVLIYLALPAPPPLPPLPDSVRSTEPGDTVQIPNVSAYFSDWQRKQVTEFYFENFARSAFLRIPLPTIKLNHPPETARLVIRDQILTSYLEEFVQPLRGSLYVNGWEPDVYFAQNPPQRSSHQILVGGRKYFSKTTLRTFQSSLTARLILLSATLALGLLGWKLLRRILEQA